MDRIDRSGVLPSLGLGVAALIAALAGAGCGRSPSGQPAVPPVAAPPSPAAIFDTPAHPDLAGPADAPYRFRDVARQAGVQFRYYNGARGLMHIREAMGGGVGMIDLDGDGRPDLFFTDGCDLPRDPSDRRHRGRLFRNRGDGRFVDVTEATGLEDFGYGQGCAVGDYDNDGFDDLFVTHFGSTALFRNNGDGTFRDVTAAAGVSCPLWSTACAFGDLSGDGRLDLFVTGYLDVGLTGELICRDRRGRPATCGPEHFRGQSFRLFQNQGDGTFADRSRSAGVVLPDSKGLAVAILDLDDDGRLDVFVVNDAEPARLFHNRGGCRFEEVGLAAGLAYSGEGQVYNGMGIAAGDYDGDGRIDLFVTNFYEQGALLFQNRGHGSFRDASGSSGLGPATRPRTSFGTEFLDIDNDGWLDLFVAAGHIADLRGDGIPYGMKAQLFHNQGGGRLRDVSAHSGGYFQTQRLGRGVAVGDLDDDGGSDIVVAHNIGPVAVLRNETPGRGHYLAVDLVGTRSSRTPYGARLTAMVGRRTLVRVLGGGGSYLSASDRRIVLGLGPHTRVSRLVVDWPSGGRDRWDDLAADRRVRLVEGRSPLGGRDIASAPANDARDRGPMRSRSGSILHFIPSTGPHRFLISSGGAP